jgi:hypothetical protein
LSSKPPANIFESTRGLFAIVRNNSNGSTPGGVTRASASATAGS